ncbi:MAG TPA: hypothetical protein VJP02_18990 [Candidatus Sulfotelmatobacter sp.]|nr:hypothetical protein [Candidatus Sulfotelmatobacter sp.]
MRAPYVAVLTLLSMGLSSGSREAYPQKASAVAPAIPRTWDDAAIATLEVPLADPVGSPKHVSADYYYRIPVAPIYKSYPIYTPGHEPARYLDSLKQQEPVIVWDDAGHAPPLKTDSDWIIAGEIVFGAAIDFDRFITVAESRDPAWYEKIGSPVAKDGTMPFARYVIREKGTVEVGQLSCAMCHTRVMPDNTILKGAQGNFPVVRAVASKLRASAAQSKDPAQLLTALRLGYRAIWSMPWLSPDPEAPVNQMSMDELVAAQDAFPPGVVARQRTNLYYPAQVPDLIGVKDRHYLDRTGLQQQRSIGDLMRYAAMNRGRFDGGDALANHHGFISADPPRFQKLPDPATQSRYSDEQLYALALYVYSLQPPPNPNKFDAVAERGQKVFERQGCTMCHTPPLYTNNMLTPAEGFTVPEEHRKKYAIVSMSVGTDSNLTLKTRRGTGYYKVPSLKGVWYRGMFGHSGWCATLEDWFDPRRVRDDYVPTGFKPHGAKTYAVKGHLFGLSLPDEDRKALIAFLKTL